MAKALRLGFKSIRPKERSMDYNKKKGRKTRDVKGTHAYPFAYKVILPDKEADRLLRSTLNVGKPKPFHRSVQLTSKW